ncbi:helix-turn-helix domain-containing protein [Paenibacillus alba]|uniref:Helix-turn-helix transcriptional regulator n=1 Tax=Paenibacillus alba TaxID=1197127 RepID=A0ABU6GBA9_9BACL|nr:helix-turn-helix transcriptional regulator [Paenibacillus alba]MEC0231255.1 helix-turn-helix transcriptional regulator [Paenibacillus alba]
MKIVVRDTENLKKIIITKGYSIRSFGRALGTSGPYANQIVNSVRNPGPIIARNIVDLLGVQYDEIFFIESGNKSDQAV